VEEPDYGSGICVADERTAKIGSGSLGTLGLEWTIEESGDFNGTPSLTSCGGTRLRVRYMCG